MITLYRLSTNNVVTHMSPSPRFNKFPQALLYRLKPSRSTHNVVTYFPPNPRLNMFPQALFNKATPFNTLAPNSPHYNSRKTLSGAHSWCPGTLLFSSV